jgi:hypothetical protein
MLRVSYLFDSSTSQSSGSFDVPVLFVPDAAGRVTSCYGLTAAEFCSAIGGNFVIANSRCDRIDLTASNPGTVLANGIQANMPGGLGNAGFGNGLGDLWFNGGNDSIFYFTNTGGAGGRTSIVYGGTENLTVTNSGKVGIGNRTNPSTKLDVDGEVKIANSGQACNANTEGAMRYKAADKVVEFCDGTSWEPINNPGRKALCQLNIPSDGSISTVIRAQVCELVGTGADQSSSGHANCIISKTASGAFSNWTMTASTSNGYVACQWYCREVQNASPPSYCSWTN